MTSNEMATQIGQGLYTAKAATRELRDKREGDLYLRDVEADITAAIAAYEKWRRTWEQEQTLSQFVIG